MATTQTFLNQIKQCKSCGLCNNQPPLLDNKKKADVMWVGLSAVKVDCTITDTPLSNSTNTGKLLSKVEDLNRDVDFYKTNLVKCLPIQNKKIRYPKEKEMKSCFNNLEKEISIFNPKIVFLLGKQVADFVSTKLTLKFKNSSGHEVAQNNKTIFVSVHHPSYILVYRRKQMNTYIRSITRVIEKFADNSV